MSQLHEGIENVMETHPDTQYLQGFFDTSRQYLHLTHADNRVQNWSTHVVPADTFVPGNVNQVQRMPRRGRGHKRAQPDEVGPSNQGERVPSHHGKRTPFYQGDMCGRDPFKGFIQGEVTDRSNKGRQQSHFTTRLCHC